MKFLAPAEQLCIRTPLINLCAKDQNDTTCPSYKQITWSNNGEIELIPNVHSVGECFKLCVADVECVGHTWYGYNDM